MMPGPGARFDILTSHPLLTPGKSKPSVKRRVSHTPFISHYGDRKEAKENKTSFNLIIHGMWHIRSAERSVDLEKYALNMLLGINSGASRSVGISLFEL